MQLSFNVNMLLLPSVATLSIFLINKITEKKRTNALLYIILFLTLLVFQIVKADEYCSEYPTYENYLSPNQRTDMFKKAVWHTQEGHKYLNSAENRCICMPPVYYRDLSLEVLGVCTASIANGNLKSKAVSICLGGLAMYLQSVYREWNALQDDMWQSQYNFEMAEFYQDLLFRGEVNE